MRRRRPPPPPPPTPPPPQPPPPPPKQSPLQPRLRRRPAGQGPMSLPNRRRLGAAPCAAGAASSRLPPLAASPPPAPRHRQPPSRAREGADHLAPGSRRRQTTALLPASFPPRHLAGRSSPTPSRGPLPRNPAVSVLPPRSTAATRPGRPGPQKPAQMLLRRRQRSCLAVGRRSCLAVARAAGGLPPGPAPLVAGKHLSCAYQVTPRADSTAGDVSNSRRRWK